MAGGGKCCPHCDPDVKLYIYINQCSHLLQVTLVLFWLGWGCWGGMVTRTGGAQKLHWGEATVFGAGASWPHLWGCSDCDSHPGVGRNPTVSGWQTLLGAHWDAEEIWHAHQPSVCPEWRVSEVRASPLFPLLGKPDRWLEGRQLNLHFYIYKMGINTPALVMQFEMISLTNILYFQAG